MLLTFYIIGIIFGLIFLFLNGAAFFGMDSDMDVDVDGSFVSDFDINNVGSVDVDGEFNYDTASGIMGEALTLRSLVTFLTFFGWVGVFCIEQDYNIWLSIIISIILSMIITTIFASIMLVFKKLQATPTDINANDVINKAATVYLFIPGKDLRGKIQVSIRGALRTIDAISTTGERINTNSQVIVNEFITDNLVKVSKIN